MTTQITEADVREWLAQRANQTLLRHGGIISASFHMESRTGPYSVTLHARTSEGVHVCRFGEDCDEAERALFAELPTARDEANRLRNEAARMLAEAAQLDEASR